MDYDSKDVMIIELEPETDVEEFVGANPELSTTNEVSDDTGRQDIGPSPSPSVVIGKLSAWDDAGNPLVDYPNNLSECFLPARSTVPMKQAALGREVALLFLDGDPRQPLIIGLLQPPHAKPSADGGPSPSAEIDGERLVFTAEQEIVFRCGQASLTLTRAGKVLIRGAYVLSRSSGVNRIKGGSVQIN